MLLEATHIITFPRRSAKETYKYLYEKKLNLPKKTIEIINGVKSNFVCIKNNVPKKQPKQGFPKTVLTMHSIESFFCRIIPQS
jgi:hypothetical protein